MKALKTLSTAIVAIAAMQASSIQAGLPDPGMTIQPGRTAVVITDPQNDFLSPEGVTWGVVGQSVTANNTVEHIESLLKAAKKNGMPVYVSPHYYYPTDDGWQFGGAVETMMHGIHMFSREGALSMEGFEGSGADWLEQYKPYLNDGQTVVASPHKVYGPDSNDLALQLRKRGIDKVILAGMSANLCVESHLRSLLEAGFEVTVVTDATAAAIVPDDGLDGYQAAMTNFRFLASDLWNTQEAVSKIKASGKAAEVSSP
jgi:nicotinamidase-related amidase